MNLIRKISIGRDYKLDAMHYSLDQEVFGRHVIVEIVELDDKYVIWIQKGNELKPWKEFNKNMAISVEYSLNY